MDEIASNNRVVLCGMAAGEPLFSHENRAERFFTFPLEVERLSGAVDTIHIIARQSILDSLEPVGGEKLCVSGDVSICDAEALSA